MSDPSDPNARRTGHGDVPRDTDAFEDTDFDVTDDADSAGHAPDGAATGDTPASDTSA